MNGADLLGGILGTGDASNLLNNLGGVGNIAGLGTGDLGLSNILSGLNPTTSLNPNGALDLVQHSVGVIGGLSNPDSASGSIANLLSGVDKLIDPVEGVLTKLPGKHDKSLNVSYIFYSLEITKHFIWRVANTR